MAKFKKRPVVDAIDAWRLPMTVATSAEILDDGIVFKTERGVVVEAQISTQDGPLTVSGDDYIIRTQNGELCPVNSDAFEALYERV